MRSRSFLTKLTVFGFLLCTLPVLFIGYFSYATSSSEIQKHVNKGNTQLLIQINANVEQIVTTVNHTLNQVINSTVLQNAMRSPLTVNDFKLYNDLRNELRHMQSFDTQLEDVVLLNEKQNWMVKNSGLYRFDEYAYNKELSELLHGQTNNAWLLTPSNWFYSEENANSVSCPFDLSLVKRLPVNSLAPSSLIMANIPACSLQSVLQNETDGRSDTIMVLDDQNRILLHPDSSLIGQPVSAAGFDRIDAIGPTSGQFKAEVDNQSYSVAYYRSPYNGWTYLSFTSIAGLTKESDKIGLYTLSVCLLMLLMMMLFAWLGSRRIYSPIQKLLKQIDDWLPGAKRAGSDEFQVIGEQIQRLFQSHSRLEGEIRQHLHQVRTFYLIRAFQGSVKKSQLTEQLSRFGYRQQLDEWQAMAVITLQIDSLEGTRYDKSDGDLLLFAVCNMIEELIKPPDRLAPVVIDQTVVLLYGSAANESRAFNSTLYRVTESLQSRIQEILELTVSIGMSLPFESVKQLAIAYREALDALKHRLKLGEGIVIQYGNVNAGKHYMKNNYPVLAESELIDAIKLADRERAKELLERVLRPVFDADLSPQEYQIPLARLLNALLMAMQESGIGLHQIRHDQSSIFEEMIKLNTVPEIEDWFWTGIVLPLIRIFRDRQQSQYHNISEKIIDLVQRHYDTDLSLEECATRLNYNANYLSSVFRKETGVSFSEYLTAYRFGMAKRWLTDTGMPVKDIAARLRYNNPQNFIRSFRKLEGLTPGQYRDKFAKDSGMSLGS
ncbi:helix-turn-helix domain-containing protein [Cohnella lubricantis]|uniref:AraC family transcriptional regulator n=1 Tax=Cohnella lubricantis TaxID=2163172 RepID=A0A841TDU2_9BACL|nr:helix-turn-helix domain-containing protein [Cohnella lubricantis]MBB6678159.1 AraC family transcriptional regulator [Cohnella lubricantis]MBP2119715.1 AraC-like DNA-binding protein/GGDEF domain-containing protein [Cohnella lubricantis]